MVGGIEEAHGQGTRRWRKSGRVACPSRWTWSRPRLMVWSGEADFLVARTTEGEIGILTDHEPVMAALATGAVIIESGNDRTTVGVHGGFLQVLRNQVTLLTDRAEVASGGREGAAELAAELSRVEEEQTDEGPAEGGPSSSTNGRFDAPGEALHVGRQTRPDGSRHHREQGG